MKYIAANAPSSSDVVLTNPTFDFIVDRSSGRGQIVTVAEARTSEQLSRLRENLSDKEHEITGAGPKQMMTRKGEYGWEERETIRIAPRAWDPLAKPVVAKDKVPAKPDAKTDKPETKTEPKSGDKPDDKAKETPETKEPATSNAGMPVAKS